MNTEQINTTQRPKKRTGLVIAGALAGVIAIGGGVALAGGPQRGFGGHGGMPGMAIMRLMERLDLNDQQELQLIKIRKNLHQQGKDAHKDMAASFSQVLD